MVFVISGDPALVEVSTSNIIYKDDGQPGSRRGSYDRGRRVTPVEERTLKAEAERFSTGPLFAFLVSRENNKGVTMRRHSLFVLVLAAASLFVYPASALAQRPAGGGAPAPRPDINNPNSRPDPNQPEVRRVDDRRFLQDATMGGLHEVALGKLAVEKGSSDAVKQFGQKMIDDHVKANDELKQIAAAGA